MGIDMLEAKYYKDYRHNYMILQCGQRDMARSYQYRILTSDKIREILRCCVRHVNGITYYYYDISSRTTLESLYKGKKMSYEQVRDVLRQIYGICDRLAGYFMDETKLVLLPEHIYYDFTDDKYIGLYYPDYQMTGAEAVKPLMDFLLEHIDTNDVWLTEDMYRIYEMAEEPQFIMEDALQILEEREGRRRDAATAAEASEITNRMRLQENGGTIQRGNETASKKFQPVKQDDETLQAQNCISGWEKERLQARNGAAGSDKDAVWNQDCTVRNIVYKDSTAQWETNEQPEYASTASQKREKGLMKRHLFYIVFSILSLLSIGGALAVYSIYDLTPEEEMALYGAMAAMGICFFICAAKILSCRQGSPKEKEECCHDHFADLQGDSDREYCKEKEEILLDRVISRDMDLDLADLDLSDDRREHYRNGSEHNMGMEYRGNIPEYGTDSKYIDRPERIAAPGYCRRDAGRYPQADAIREEDNYGNTIFFDESMIEEGKLYAMDQRNKNHIELKHFPYTIGKAAGCVDYVLPDRSVSRIHARFDKEGEKLLLTDMNSTNGTYKNGLRMQPRETVEIEPGDEIRFGNLNYCYR